MQHRSVSGIVPGLAALAGILVMACGAVAIFTGQSPVHAAAQLASATKAAQAASSKSHAAGNAAAMGQKLATSTSAHAASLATLSKIEILPSSISIMGPRYSQRVIVEGLFADGHQEDLTSRAKLAVSDPRTAQVDKDDFVLPRGDGKATVTATRTGPSRVGILDRRITFLEPRRGVFATMCCR